MENEGRTLVAWNDRRTVDSTGLIWQDGPYGEKIIGEIHGTRAGRLNVVMLGRKITEKSLATFDEARAVALDYVPEGDAVRVLACILDPSVGR